MFFTSFASFNVFFRRLVSSNEDETCKEQPEKEYISPLRGTRE